VRQQQINLLTGTWDLGVCQNETRHLHEVLASKGINHRYEVWQDSGHDWPYWFKQIREFI
jgi:esterase/lipase superfamily enzyme